MGSPFTPLHDLAFGTVRCAPFKLKRHVGGSDFRGLLSELRQKWVRQDAVLG